MNRRRRGRHLGDRRPHRQAPRFAGRSVQWRAPRRVPTGSAPQLALRRGGELSLCRSWPSQVISRVPWVGMSIHHRPQIVVVGDRMSSVAASATVKGSLPREDRLSLARPFEAGSIWHPYRAWDRLNDAAGGCLVNDECRSTDGRAAKCEPLLRSTLSSLRVAPESRGRGPYDVAGIGMCLFPVGLQATPPRQWRRQSAGSVRVALPVSSRRRSTSAISPTSATACQRPVSHRQVRGAGSAGHPSLIAPVRLVGHGRVLRQGLGPGEPDSVRAEHMEIRAARQTPRAVRHQCRVDIEDMMFLSASPESLPKALQSPCAARA